ncbi:MAG: Mur ligase family protein [Anaerolineae bacterium]|nr:Mur ligase family protein [Anaerolineae bacterium]
MRFTNEQDAIAFIFHTQRRVTQPRGLDEHTRDVTPTRHLLLETRLLDTPREYAVVTGSKGKGSTTAITARLLHSLGHSVGMVTGPHLVQWYERIRINGEMIPPADFFRILSDLAPAIEAEAARLNPQQYISPQGIFLLIALRWFDERGVAAAVLEVGRGGRFDDIALVPNKVALFTPIVLEHTQYLGSTVERIAWHKSGIIKPQSYVYSVAQSPEVLAVLEREAEAREAEFFWFGAQDIAEYLGDAPDGIRLRLGRYGTFTLPLLGRYQAENVTLAVQAAGNMHGRLKGVPHGSPDYIAAIRAGLASVRWPGRLHRLQRAPDVYVEGAITEKAVRGCLESLATRATRPYVIIAGVPRDRDYPTIYRLLAAAADHLILTETTIHPNIHFPEAATALATARQFQPAAQHRPTLPEALALAHTLAGTTGTILLAVAQPLVGEAMLLWQVDTGAL